AAVRDVAAIGGAVRPAGIAFIAIALLGAMALLGIAATATWTSLPTPTAIVRAGFVALGLGSKARRREAVEQRSLLG
ncbi:hypothetical protein, partial [Mesorhizobium sp.]|uniref:hypothetical protein n=1 Tax=Mesorhizobium sp. TaxID=1871066 RepID=UPI0025BA73A7